MAGIFLLFAALGASPKLLSAILHACDVVLTCMYACVCVCVRVCSCARMLDVCIFTHDSHPKGRAISVIRDSVLDGELVRFIHLFISNAFLKGDPSYVLYASLSLVRAICLPLPRYLFGIRS